MFDTIRTFLSDLAASDEPEVIVHSHMQLAEAALMYHVIAIDGVIKDRERAKMIEVLADKFNLDDASSKALLHDAKTAEAEAVDFYQFTTILKNALEEEERISIIENLWELVFADGSIHELEDNFIWRVSGLLGVDAKDRMAQKRKVAQRQ